MLKIRLEEPRDQAAVRQLNEIAFENASEAAVVDALRTACDNFVSFVADDQGALVGHILFTPATLDGSDLTGMGLAPMAVSPNQQRRGIGSLLVRHGLEHLRRAGCPFVIVLGHPEYYPRFGFEPASRYNLRCQWEGVPDAAFMAVVFDRDALPSVGGIARYRGEFDAAM